MQVEIVYPNNALVSSFLDSVSEMQSLGEKIWPSMLPCDGESPEQFVARLNLGRTSPPPGLVPESQYWGVAGGQVVGRISLRYFLNENLKKFGGHIGYEVRPSARRKGVATAMLKALLQTDKAKSIGRLMLTCAPDNLASNKTILNNGGLLEKTVFVEEWQRQTNYYWINLFS